MSPSLPREGRGFFVPELGAAFIEQRGKAHAGVGDGTAADGQGDLPCFTAGREKGNILFLKRWDSGVGRIFRGGGRWESGLMGKPLYGSREGQYTLGLGMEQSPLGRCGLPCCTAGREKGNSFFPKRWDSGVGRIFWGGGRWESGLMGETALREQRRKAHAGVGDGTAADGQVWPPCFTREGEKGNILFPKGGRGEMFLPEAKKWNDPLPAGRESC